MRGRSREKNNGGWLVIKEKNSINWCFITANVNLLRSNAQDFSWYEQWLENIRVTSGEFYQNFNGWCNYCRILTFKFAFRIKIYESWA